MSRLKNFFRNLTASCVQQGVVVVYSLVSVPLILRWLPKAEFGLWSLLVQLMSYVVLVDLGMNSALARFLVDHKDRRDEGGYGSLVKTSAVVSVVQGLIVLAVVTLGSPLLTAMMKIPVEYQRTFIALMRIQGLIAAFMFCTNPLSTVEAYDPATNTWTTDASMPTARDGLGAGVINGKLYAVGGENSTGQLRTLEVFNPR